MKVMILAIDCGTTGTRALLIDSKGTCLHSHYESLKLACPQAGYVEQDPLELWQKTQHCIQQLLQKCKHSEIAGLAISNQRETLITWDKNSGQAFYPAISWQCRRTENICTRFSKESNTIQKITGLTLDAYFSAPKIMWVLENVPAAKTAYEKGQLLAGTVDSWLIWQLSGQKTFVTDSSNASRSLVMDINTGAYSPELLKLFGLRASIFPRIVSHDEPIAELDEKLFGFKAPIKAVLGDQQASLYALCEENTQWAKCTYGTGLFFNQYLGTQRKSEQGLLETIAMQKQQHCHYALEGSMFMGGALIQWLKESLKLFTTFEEMQALYQESNPNTELIFVPALVGLGAPYWRSDLSGNFIGLRQDTTNADLLRAVLESICFQVMDCIDVLQEKPKTLRVDGGVSQNPWLMQLQADILGIPLEIVDFADATVWGVSKWAAKQLDYPMDAWQLSCTKIEPKTHKPESRIQQWKSTLSQVLQQ